MSFDGKILAVWLLGGAIVALITLAIWASNVEAQGWQAFSAAHHCRIVGEMESSVAPGVTSSGKFAMTFIPGKTGFQCDNGVTYWRDK